MNKYNFKKLLRQKVNLCYYDKLKLLLANFPSIKLNHYILSVVKPFLKCGKLEIIKDKDVYTLLFYNGEYKGSIKIKDKEVSISMSSYLKIGKQELRRKVKFNKNNIVILNTSLCETPNTILENTQESIFKNNWQINNFGENDLIYQRSFKFQKENRKSTFFQEIVRLNNDNTALVEVFNSETQEIIYFKGKAINTTFEELLTKQFINLDIKEISKEERDYFENIWLKENPIFGNVISATPIKKL